MNSSLANRNCTAKFEMCISHSMVSAHFQFSCVGTNSKGGDGAKGSNYLLWFGAWDVPMEDEIGKVSSEGFLKERQLENEVQNAVMRDSLLWVTSPHPSGISHILWQQNTSPIIITSILTSTPKEHSKHLCQFCPSFGTLKIGLTWMLTNFPLSSIF